MARLTDRTRNDLKTVLKGRKTEIKPNYPEITYISDGAKPGTFSENILL